MTGPDLLSAYAEGRRDFRGADLREAVLSGADLTGADLTGADLTDADLNGVDLSGVNLTGANLTGANLTGAILTGAILTDAVLIEAVLTDADLIDADLIDADLIDADLTDADLTGADLTGADLSGARGLPEAPVIEHIDARILAEIEREGCALDMTMWHYRDDECATTHCRAGWAIHLAGDAGYALEARLGASAAGALIYAASRPGVRVPDWYASNDEALADLRACAAADPLPASSGGGGGAP